MKASTLLAGQLGCLLIFSINAAGLMPAGTFPGWEGELPAIGYGTGKDPFGSLFGQLTKRQMTDGIFTCLGDTEGAIDTSIQLYPTAWERMDPTWRGEIVQLSWSPRAYLLKGFLSDAEADHIIEHASPKMEKSTVVDRKTGGNVPSNIRTSTGTFFRQGQDNIVSRIEARVAQVSMIPVENQEGLQILHYHDGEKYEPHWDYFNDPINSRPETGGQRIATVLMYLTTVEEGGETVFPNADTKLHLPSDRPISACAAKGMSVKAIKGDAVMFFALHPDGTLDPSSLHGSCPTLKGDKWSATKWIHVGHFGMRHDGPKGAACADSDTMCSAWAERGECKRNEVWMTHYCRKACGVCPTNRL